MGSLLVSEWVKRSMNSLLSSRMVRSAENVVSKTCFTPMARMAAARRFSVALSWLRPRLSPQAARTAGATWKTTSFVGSQRASKTSSVSSRSRRAPTGQWLTHWPQRAQLASFMRRPPLMRTVVWAPEPVTSHTPRDCTRSQTDTQRRHLMHLELSRRMGRVLSQGRSVASLRKGTS